MRDLLFHHERKLKRASKIKSKAYRKAQKKTKVARAEADAHLGTYDKQTAQKLQLQREVERVRERMTLRHKNSSRWAKKALKQQKTNPALRQAVAEQLARGEELRKKQNDSRKEGADSEEEESEEEGSSDEDEGVANGEDGSAESMRPAGRKASAGILSGEPEPAMPEKGLLSMNFMRKAMGRQRAEAAAVLEELESAGTGHAATGDADESSGKSRKRKSPAKGGDGEAGGARGAFGKSRVDQPISVPVALPTSEEREPEQAPSKGARKSARKGGNATPQGGDDGSRGAPTVRHDAGWLGEASGAGDWLLPPAEEVATAPLVTDGAAPASGEGGARTKRRRGGSAGGADGPTHNHNAAAASAAAAATLASEMEAASAADDLVAGASLIAPAPRQRRMIDEAFPQAGVELEVEKAQLVEDEAAAGESAAALPGWGSWGGLGAVPSRNDERKAQSAAEARSQLLQDAAARRKDAALRHVIVSEKRNKKAAAFTTAGVPFPFSSREQFERSLRAPLGREWNTAASQKSLVAPKVVIAKGAAIDPIAPRRKAQRSGA